MHTLTHWIKQSALPFWGTRGVDHSTGGFHERMHLDGTPDRDVPRRAMVLARQIYVHAHAAALGWYPAGKERAFQALEVLLTRYRSPDGAPGYVHSVAADGTIANSSRDTYAHTFILLGLAWLARTSGDAQINSLIEETLAFIDGPLSASDGTLLEGLPPSVPRRQNPHMHFYEALLALHEAIAFPSAIKRAQQIRSLLPSHFLDVNGGLVEFFDDDWQIWAGKGGGLKEPGHYAEWSWLLRKHDRLTGANADPLAEHLFARAVDFLDPNTGFLPDYCDDTEQALTVTRRCWPQTEMLKAWLAEYEWGGSESVDRADQLMRNVMKHYIRADTPGLWNEQFDSTGRPLIFYVPASTLYHLFCAAAEYERVREIPSGEPDALNNVARTTT